MAYLCRKRDSRGCGAMIKNPKVAQHQRSPYVFLIGKDDDCPGVVRFQQLLDGFVVILQLGVVGNFQRLGDADSTFFIGERRKKGSGPRG